MLTHLALARRDHGGDRQLRLRRRADPRRPPRADHAHAGEGRGHEPRRARRRASATTGRSRPSRSTSTRVERRGIGDQRRGAARPHAAAALRHGRGGDRARRHGRRDRARCKRWCARRWTPAPSASRTSKSATHIGYAGKPVPSRRPTVEEMDALAAVMGELKRGMIQATIGRDFLDQDMAEVSRKTGGRSPGPRCSPA